MKNIAYYNGKTAPIEEMMVPMNDRACYFGDGVYDATCVVNHVPMAFDDHIDRIYRSAKLIDIEIPMEKAEMKRDASGPCRSGGGRRALSLLAGDARRGHA